MSIQTIQKLIMDWLPEGGAVLLLFFLIGVGWVLKNCTSFPNRSIPIALSCAGMFLYPFVLRASDVVYNVHIDWLVAAMQGGCIGLGSSGLYEVIKEFSLKEMVLRFIRWILRLNGGDGKTPIPPITPETPK